MGSFGSGVEEVVLKELPHPDPYKIPSENSRPESPDSRCGVSAPETKNTARPESPDPMLQKSSDKIQRTCMWLDEQVLGKVA